jgi:exodeoxyribonuclease VII large subunit
MNSTDLSKTPLTVSELNKAAAEILEQCLSQIWIQGELSTLSRPASGHWYFSLKDDKAQVRCAFFKHQQAKSAETRQNWTPKVGDQVLILGQVTLYQAQGDYQVIVQKIQPLGTGALQQAFEKLKQKLLQEGLFDADKRRALPLYPQKIALVTSSTGAALQDLLKVLNTRFPAELYLYPSLVQGPDAPTQLIQALKQAQADKLCDLIILARGGGSLEDLAAFNDENLVRAVAHCSIPIITGIGHETDISLCDWAADQSAPTPSAAAMMATPDKNHLQQELKHFRQRLQKLLQNQLNECTYQLDRLALKLIHPKIKLDQQQKTLEQLKNALTQAYKHSLHNKRQEVLHLATALDWASPLKTLDRGYSLTWATTEEARFNPNQYRAVDFDQTQTGDLMLTQMRSGLILSRVIKTHKQKIQTGLNS